MELMTERKLINGFKKKSNYNPQFLEMVTNKEAIYTTNIESEVVYFSTSYQRELSFSTITGGKDTSREKPSI